MGVNLKQFWILETADLDYKLKYPQLSRHINLGGSAMHIVFSLTFNAAKQTKSKITVLGYKRGSKI